MSHDDIPTDESTAVDPMIFDLLYGGAALPAIALFSLYTLRQGTPSDLLEIFRQKSGCYENLNERRYPVWIHAASVGEVQTTPPLIHRLEEMGEAGDFVLTTNTLTGRNVSIEKYGRNHSSFLPADFSWSVQRAFSRISPDVLLLMEQELWPNLIQLARRRNTPVVIVNGRMTEQSHHLYDKLPDIVKRTVFGNLERVAAQNETYADRFRSLGVPPERIDVTGNLKYEALLANRPTDNDVRELEDILQLTNHEGPVLTGGSIHPPEDEYLVQTFRSVRNKNDFSNARLLLVPRHLKNTDRAREKARDAGFQTSFLSELRENSEQMSPPPEVVVIDEMGVLNTVYGIDSIVFVGGSLMDHGGQNMLEPAAVGRPVLVGPHTDNFRQEMELLNSVRGIDVVSSPEELTERILHYLRQPREARSMGKRAKKAIAEHGGAVDRTLEIVKSYLRNTGD